MLGDQCSLLQMYYFYMYNNTDDFTHPASVNSHFLLELQLQVDWIFSHAHVYVCVVCFYQVVVKTKADYDGESKKGKLRSPKIAEFSISIIEGVSERLKVRVIHHPIFQYISHTPTHAYAGEQTAVSLRLRTFVPGVIISPLPSKLNAFARATFTSCVLCSLSSRRATRGDIMHNDSLNPALTLSLIQLLPWRWPPNGSIPPASLNAPPTHPTPGRQMCLAVHTI